MIEEETGLFPSYYVGGGGGTYIVMDNTDPKEEDIIVIAGGGGSYNLSFAISLPLNYFSSDTYNVDITKAKLLNEDAGNGNGGSGNTILGGTGGGGFLTDGEDSVINGNGDGRDTVYTGSNIKGGKSYMNNSG